MSWSWKLFRLKGIDVRVHVTFVLILVWAGYFWGVSSQRGVQGALFGVVATLLLFACVTLHEFGHSLVAMHYGAHVHSITLLPIGGLAQIEDIPEKPKEELAVALAGPLVNLIIASVLIVVGVVLDAQAVISLNSLMDALQHARWSGLLAYLGMANLLLGIFNLLPAFPMDGGRVLRALLAMRLDFRQATLIAARIGQALALAMGFLAFIIGDWLLILIAIFIWLGASGEQQQTDLRSVLGNVTVGQVMTREPLTLSASDSLARAVDLTLTTSQGDFPVLERGTGRLVGVLTSDRLFRALREHPHDDILVGSLHLDGTNPAGPDEPLVKAQELMANGGGRALAVVGPNGEIVGMLTQQDLIEGYRVLSAGWRPVLLPH